MELNPIKDAFDSVIKKQTLSSSKIEDTIEQITQEIQQTLSGIQSAINVPSSQPKLILGELKTKLKEIAPLNHLEATQKELNIAMHKYTKLLEKQLYPNIWKPYRTVDFNSYTINHIITSNLYHERMFEINDCFINEAHEKKTMVDKKPKS